MPQIFGLFGIDKVIHFFGGGVVALMFYVALKGRVRYELLYTIPILMTALAGIGVEVFEIIFDLGVFDWNDIAATFMGTWFLIPMILSED